MILRQQVPGGVSERFFDYEDLFGAAERESGVPATLWRTIAERESSFDPKLVHPTSKATGLLQMLPVVLEDYNAAATRNHERTYTIAELKDPVKNVAVATWFAKQILTTYFGKHRALQADWSSKRFVELFIFAYHAGPPGVVLVVSSLEKKGVPTNEITIARVAAEAKTMLARAFPYALRKTWNHKPLSPAESQALGERVIDGFVVYDRRTVNLYAQTRELAPGPRIASRDEKDPHVVRKTLTGVALVGTLGYLASRVFSIGERR